MSRRSSYRDLSGQKFGELTAIRIDLEKTKSSKNTYWFCECSCGSIKSYIASNLTRNHTTSCGCKTNLMKHKTHGKTNTRLYKLWLGMRKRCYNPTAPHYEYYGGRGITVCDEWKNDFMSFYNWSYENGYSDDLSIDRIDNDKGYSPDNCRWETIKNQARNKTNLLYANVNGVEKTLCEWSEIYGIPLNALRLRYLRGKEKGITVFDNDFLKPLRQWPYKVEQYSLDGKLIKTWNSAEEASQHGFGSVGSIRECCSGKNETHIGYKWKYLK